MAPKGQNLPMPKGYPGGKKAWNRLPIEVQRAIRNPDDAEPVEPVTARFIGGMPGGILYNPATGQRIGASSLAPRQNIELYGVDNIIPGEFTKSPLYAMGDQWKPANNPDFSYKQNLQYKLYQLGLYDPEAEFRVGEWGEEDAKAYEKALSAANSNFTTVEEWMDQAIANPQKRIEAKGKATRKPLTVVLTDPEDLKATARGVTSTLFGRNVKLPDEFMEQLIAGYHQLQRERQIQNYNMEEVGGEIVDIPDVSSYISQRVEEQYPMQTQQDEFKGAMDSIMQGLFGG